MFTVQKVLSIDIPELSPYRTMRLYVEHRRQGIFVAEGEKVVQRLLESHFLVKSLLIEERWLSGFEPFLKKRQDEIQVYIAEKRELEKLIGFPLFQGALAVGKVPNKASLEETLPNCKSPRLLAAVEGVSNALNMGALVGNCVAFGVQALIVGETCSSPYLRRAVRNSMGAIFHLPIVESGRLVESLKKLREHGIRCVAAHPHTEEKILAKADLTQNCCVLFGNEGYGLSKEALEICDDAVAIPMTPLVDSLNVASASAVFLYEVFRQRN